MSFRKLATFFVAGIAAVAVAIGAYAIVNSTSSNGALGTADAAAVVQQGPNQQVVGQVPPNWRPGTGTIITGAAADKAKAVALAKYPGGASTVCCC